MANTDTRARLRDIIAQRSLSEGRAVTLASGATSGFYFDLKQTVFDPEGARLSADALLALLAEDDAPYVGGMAVGAIPIVAQMVMASQAGPRPRRGFFVRKEEKGHGTRRLIDGILETGARTVLVEDVTTTGGSVLKAVAAVRDFGCSVDKVLTIVDREAGARETLAAAGIGLIALYRASDFGLGG